MNSVQDLRWCVRHIDTVMIADFNETILRSVGLSVTNDLFCFNMQWQCCNVKCALLDGLNG